jgi:hypothetical protein
MKERCLARLALLALVLLPVRAALAALITTADPEALVVNFDEFPDHEYVPAEAGVEVGGSLGVPITLTSSEAGLIVTTLGGGGFGDNGGWNFLTRGNGNFAASSSGDDPYDRYLLFSFAQPLSSVGGFINYCTGPYLGCGGSDVAIAALGVDDTILEQYNLIGAAPIGPIGAFRGIERGQNDIYGLLVRSSGTYFALDDLTFSVPEPAGAILVLASGLALAFWRTSTRPPDAPPSGTLPITP